MEIEIPKRAEYLRTIWHEISRLHSHLLWAGLGADALGFESLFMQCWRIRETILDIIEQTTGGRVIFSVCKVGGVRRDRITWAGVIFMPNCPTNEGASMAITGLCCFKDNSRGTIMLRSSSAPKGQASRQLPQFVHFS